MREGSHRKPRVKLTGEDGNVFYIIGMVCRALKKAGLEGKATEYREKTSQCQSCGEVLTLTEKYVRIS